MSGDSEWIKLTVNQRVDELRAFGPTIPIKVSATPSDSVRVDALAQIDTGANHSCLTEALAGALGLPSIGTLFQHAAGREPQNVPIHRARLWLPGGTNIDADLAILASLREPHAILIGRDILQFCRLNVDFTNGRVEFHIRRSLGGANR